MSLKEAILGHVSAYIALQRLVGADILRYVCLDILGAEAGERILDVGCGPAYYVRRLPSVEYHGFDTDCRYIEYARARYGDRGTFYCEEYSESQRARLPKFDGILLMGLLHHLSDDQCDHLLGLLARSLASGGRIVTLDTCFTRTQGAVRRLLAENDRGNYVRYPEALRALAERRFQSVEERVLVDVARIPSDYYVMTLREPVTSPATRRA